MQWHKNKDAAIRGEIDESEWAAWDLHNPEKAWQVYTMLENIEWKHLPDAGGLLDQDEALMQDLSVIAYQSQIIRQMIDADKKEQG